MVEIDKKIKLKNNMRIETVKSAKWVLTKYWHYIGCPKKCSFSRWVKLDTPSSSMDIIRRFDNFWIQQKLIRRVFEPKTAPHRLYLFFLKNDHLTWNQLSDFDEFFCETS